MLFDFSSFNLGENGTLNSIGILHSEYNTQFGETDCSGGP